MGPRADERTPGGPSRRRVLRRPVLLAWACLATWTSVPYAVALSAPPPGRAFVGVFHWTDDLYNYLSYVRQAETGSVVFDNRLLPPGNPTLVNVEWWLMGVTSRALGRRPLLAFRLWGLAFGLLLLAAMDAWLRRAGLPESCRLPALLLVGLGGGWGGPLFALTDLPVQRCLDLSMGLFPFMELLANPHFVAGTALLTASLVAFLSGRTAWGLGLGWLLGLTRPYDLALLGLLAGVAVVSSRPVRDWRSGLLPLLGLLPVLGYDLWVFFASPQFASFRGAYAFPRPEDLVPALGPAAALGILAVRLPQTPARAPFRRTLWAWAAVAPCLAAVRPGSFGQQLLVGSGTPLLALAGLGLSRRGTGAVLAGLLALLPTSLIATRIVLTPDPHWHVPKARLAAALALDGLCTDDARLFAPPDISLYGLAHASCRPYVAHEATPGYPARLARALAFYAPASPEARRTFLERECIDVLALPSDPGTRPASWLGDEAPFVQAARIGDPVELSWYTRTRPCHPEPGPPPEPR